MYFQMSKKKKEYIHIEEKIEIEINGKNNS